MKSLVYKGPGKIKLKEILIPNIQEDEVLIKIKYAAVCATDLRIFKGKKSISYPRVLGHEFAGVIEKVEKHLLNWSVGDRVTVYPLISCGECYACKAGQKNICINRKTIGYDYDGGFAEYVRIPAKAIQMGNLIKLPKNVNFKEAAVSEPLAAAYNGIVKSNLKEGEVILIIGAGPIGLFHIELARLRKPSLIIVSEPMEEKRKLAKLLGADVVVDPLKDSLKDCIEINTNGFGVDKILLDVSSPKIIEDTLDILKKGGTYVVFAGSPEGSTITIDPNIIHYKELKFTGASGSTPEYHQEVLRLISSKEIDVTPFVKDTFLLEEWETAFDQKDKFQSLKPLFEIGGERKR